MKKLTLFMAMLLFILNASLAQKVIPIVAPDGAGFSSARLKRIDARMNEWVEKGWMNGAVVLLLHNGKMGYYQAAGYNDLKTKALLDKEGIFRIASQTKAITSVAAMMLYEEGKFLLDDPISKYIPTFKDPKVLDKFNEKDTSYTTVPAKREVTVRDLLTHTSGIGYAQIGSKEANAIYAKSKITAGIYVTDDKLTDAMSRLGKLPLMHSPGEKWTYGLNSDVLGALVEIWSGMSLDEFFRTRIFEPLGMKDTYFNLPETKASRLVNFFQADSTGRLQKQNLVFGKLDMNYPVYKKTYFSGGAGLTSTAYDYAVFLQMLLNGGTYDGKRLLSRNTVRLMTMNQIGDLMQGHEKFGLGFSIVTPEGSSLYPNQPGTFAWGGAFTTTYWVDPVEKLVVVIYRQMWGPHSQEITEAFKTLVYQALND